MRKIRINRAKWRSGFNGNCATGKGDTKLLNDLGYMCCLGFTAHQLIKCAKSKLEDITTPAKLKVRVTPLTEFSYPGYKNIMNSIFSSNCIDINDNTRITRKERESELKAEFKTQDLELEFYGEYESYVEN